MNGIAAPAVNRAIVMRRDELIATLHGLVSVGRVIHEEEGRRIYSADAFQGSAVRMGQTVPLAVVLPANVREVSQVLRYCYETGLKVFPRGAGTSLTGAATGAEDGIVLCLSRMTRVLELDTADCLVRVEAGITTADVSQAAASHGLCYMPDPASRAASTIGGNISTNAAGARATRYGATGQHLLALKIVLSDGEVVDLGGGELEASGFDLVGLMLGSEGMLGVIVEATLRLLPMPEASRMVVLGFQSVPAALSCASGVLAAGIDISAAEVLDSEVVAVCEDFARAGLPKDVEALLIIEVDGHPDDLPDQAALIMRASEMYGPTVQFDIADAGEIERKWAACDAAFTALGRLGVVWCVDVVVPAARISEAMSHIGDIAARHSLRGANLCRAADGVVRSVFLCSTDQDDVRVLAAISDVARMTVELGGVISGDHGIGVAKREALGHQYTASDLQLQMRLKTAFDTEWLLNNGKVYPLADQAAMQVS